MLSGSVGDRAPLGTSSGWGAEATVTPVDFGTSQARPTHEHRICYWSIASTLRSSDALLLYGNCIGEAGVPILAQQCCQLPRAGASTMLI